MQTSQIAAVLAVTFSGMLFGCNGRQPSSMTPQQQNGMPLLEPLIGSDDNVRAIIQASRLIYHDREENEEYAEWIWEISEGAPTVKGRTFTGLNEPLVALLNNRLEDTGISISIALPVIEILTESDAGGYEYRITEVDAQSKRFLYIERFLK